MKRLLIVGLLAGLVASSLLSPAAAGKKKKAKPVATTLYLHGTERFGEMESFSVVSDAYLSMDPTKPTGTDSKSKGITNYGVGPNTRCAGNTLFPTYVGELSGAVKGDMKVVLNTIATPGAAVEIRVWPDIASLLCDSATSADYVEPAASVVVPLTPGQGTVEAVLEDVDFAAAASLMLQVSPATMDVAGTQRPLPPFVGRLLYDSEAAPSSISFSCTPSSGKTCA
ncbi:MAG: hypothetical protein ACLGIB_07005 [Actinomycetota bacterium]